jgi:hypothetical protein
VARTNLHELANTLLTSLDQQASNGTFEGKLREVAASAGLNSVRSAEAVKLLEELGRIEVVQRGRRGRNTIVAIKSIEPITLEDAESMLPSRAARRSTRLSYDEIGAAVVDRLLELSRDDALRSAQVEAFASDGAHLRDQVTQLEEQLTAAAERETELRVRLKSAEGALERAEENLRRAIGPTRTQLDESPRAVEDDDARAVLDILRSGRA